MPAKVSIITVNYNQTAVTAELLASIRQQDFTDLEVIVVDNASRENPATSLAARFPQTIFLRSELNLGFAGGNNLAVPHATGEYLFFINNDTELPENCISQLIHFLENHPHVGMVSPLICYFSEKNTIQYAGMTSVHPLTARNQTIGQNEINYQQYHQPRRTSYAHGAAMMIPRNVISKVGLMSEEFFLYYEELDWCARIARAGFEIWVEPRAKIYHKESLSVGQMGELKTYFLNRNRVLFMRRNFSGWRLAAFYVFLFGVTIPKNVVQYLLKGQVKALRAFLQGVLWNFFPHQNIFEALVNAAAAAPKTVVSNQHSALTT